jgi:hypothetical protein
MNKIQITVVYPKVDRNFPDPSAAEQRFPIELNVGCDNWQNSAAIRNSFCELLFAGAGNAPSLYEAQSPFTPFDSGDSGINNVHRQWATQHTRSMSVGDLIVIDPNGLNEWWLCDVVGFTLLTAEQVKSWLDYPRKYGCCSFELKKWLDLQLNLV